ncbi:ParB N-terminal domain-containing protein [candidate division KSB1 bacterium]|nr:ParB N-terminal domain-containing protein [candidate division KSB1 bacterium]
MQKKLTTLAIKDIDPDDETYRYRTTAGVESLITSIGRIGLINPLIVQVKGADVFRIVCGFKRLAALVALQLPSCPAFVINDAHPRVDLLLMAIEENGSGQLNPIELSVVLDKLQHEFKINEHDIIHTYLPMLGYGPNPRVLQLYCGLHELPPEWQSALVADQVPLDLAGEILQQSDHDQIKIWSLFQALHLSKNRGRELWRLLADIARMHDLTIAQAIDSQPVQDILNEKMTPSQKSERLKQWLWEKRYPRYSAVRATYEKILHDARLGHIRIQAPPYFEGDSYSVTFSFAGEGDFAETVAHLQRLMSDGVVEKLSKLP